MRAFPLEGNLYGRSLSAAAPPHRFLPGGKGGLYAWARVRQYPEVILVEGRFDCALLWEAGFHNVTCSLGTHLNARQLRQLCDATRTVYLAFDADGNGSGYPVPHELVDLLLKAVSLLEIERESFHVAGIINPDENHAVIRIGEGSDGLQ
jgi:hypothetical protein